MSNEHDAPAPVIEPAALAALRELLDNASPPPWDTGSRRHNATVLATSIAEGGVAAVVATFPWHHDARHYTDALVVAALRNAAPALLAELAQLRTVAADYDARGDALAIATGALSDLREKVTDHSAAVDSLSSENAQLRLLVAELTDDDPCRYDHHGYCQAHSLDEAPCPHARAKELLAESPGADRG